MKGWDSIYAATTSKELLAAFRESQNATTDLVRGALGPWEDHAESCAVWAEQDCDCGVGWRNDFRDELENRQL